MNERLSQLSEEQQVLVKKASEQIKTLYDENSTPEQQKEYHIKKEEYLLA